MSSHPGLSPRRLVRLGPVAAGLAALALLVAACGGSPYTGKDFAARAGAICADALRRVRAVPPPASDGLPALAAYLGDVVPVLRSQAADLARVRRPPGSASAVKAFVGAERSVAARYAALRAAAARGDAQGVATTEATLRSVPLQSLAARAGVPSCGVPTATAT